ncbi:MAG: hypothetical protein Q4Q04_04235 [Methanocorpusculum sp.]|nr:hypothetical protein [Methanocorpusculum sp.]
MTPRILTFFQKDPVRRALIFLLIFCCYLLERLIDKLISSKL